MRRVLRERAPLRVTAAMAETTASPGVLKGEKMASPSTSLLPDKRSPTNCHSSQTRTGKTTPSHSEKRPHVNGHASPSHIAANISNNHAVLDNYMKTDDRMRLAKERREERDRSLAAREQVIKEKERRAWLQYERTVEERWKRLDEQRQKEELRRTAVEEKRRQQLEEERERLEVLMKRSLERGLQRTKRWSKCCPSGVGDSENVPIPPAASAFPHGIASPVPAGSESAPCSPHRSPFCSSLNAADLNKAGHQGGSQSTPNTPKKERLRRDKRISSPSSASPVRRSESPASVSRHLCSPSTSKLVSKMRAQSPSNAHKYHYSPKRHHATEDQKEEDKKVEKPSEQSKQESAVKKNMINSSKDPAHQAEKNTEINESTSSKGETCNQHLKGNPSEKNLPKIDSSEKKIQGNAQGGEKKKEATNGLSAVKVAAGTTNAEEDSGLMSERRRQKELEDKLELKEEEREDQQRKQLTQEHQQERAGKGVNEKGRNEEDPHRLKQEVEKRKKKEQEEELQIKVDEEREKSKVQAQEDAERQRQNRELQTQQEEEERQLRKKRIEEIMKRTRKVEADLKREKQVETVSPPGEENTFQTNTQGNTQAIKKVEFQVPEQVPVLANKKGCALVKNEAAAAQVNNHGLPVKTHIHQETPVHSVSDWRPDTQQASEELLSRHNTEAEASLLKHQGREVEINLDKQQTANFNDVNQINKEGGNPAADAKLKQREAGVTDGEMKREGKDIMTGRVGAEVSKQKMLQRSTADRKTPIGSQVEVIRPSLKPLLMGHPSLPIIMLESLNVKDMESCDQAQPMEVSPASKEELISIPEFSPVNEIQNGSMSNNRALEDLMDLTGSITCSKLQTDDNVGDCNKNLIEGVVSPMSDSKLIGMLPQSSNKLSIK